MRILVASAFEAGAHWAHAINTIKMAEGFARLGHDVTVVCWRPGEKPVPRDALVAAYGLKSDVRWIQLPHAIFGRSLNQHWHFSIAALPALLRTRPHLVFSRSYIFPVVSSRLGFATVAESHADPSRGTPYFGSLVRGSLNSHFRTWVTISERLAEAYCALGVPAGKIAVLPDAVDLRLFRRPTALPLNPLAGSRPAVVYAGHLYDYKGIPTILEAARRLPNVQFHLVGGWPEDIQRQRKLADEIGASNIVFHGSQMHSEVPRFLWHADVLLLPPSARHPSAAWTSPVKLGEYLASGTPVVATSIPALRDWLTDEEVFFVPPDDDKALADGIAAVLDNPRMAAIRVAAALSRAEALSYERRAAEILHRAGFSDLGSGASDPPASESGTPRHFSPLHHPPASRHGPFGTKRGSVRPRRPIEYAAVERRIERDVLC